MAPGNEFEVSGYLDDNRGIRAIFLEKKDASLLEYEATGFAENRDDHLKTSMTNSLTVNYTSMAAKLPAGTGKRAIY